MKTKVTLKKTTLLMLSFFLLNQSIAADQTEIDFTKNFVDGSKKDGYEESGLYNDIKYRIRYNGTGIFAGSKNSELDGLGYKFYENWVVNCKKDVGYPYNYGKTFRQGCEGTEISRDAGDLLIRIGGATNCLGRGLATNS